MRDYPLDTEKLEFSGVPILVEYFHDQDRGAPWVEDDGHGLIREYSSYYGHPAKKPGEVVIHSSRGYCWLYDVPGTIAIARRDRWGLSDEKREALTIKLGRMPTAREVTAESVRMDMEFCAGWLRDDWSYVGIVCTVLDREGKETEHTDSCWGFETWDNYHKQAGREMAQALAEGVYETRRNAWREALREARARRYCASRDVQTVGG